MTKGTFSDHTLNLMKGFVLENLEKYGEANAKAILGKLLGSNPDLKTKIKELNQEINEVILNFSGLSKEEFKELHSKYTAHLTKMPAKEKRKGLPELSKTEKNYCLRFSPSPSGPLHIGHSIPLLLNSEYAKKYKGKCILRLEDTNPSGISLEAYKTLQEDAKWLTQNNISEVIIQSERIDLYYKYANELISKGHAYVCQCPSEEWKETVSKKEDCPCRNLSIEKQKERWQGMLTDFEEGSSVLRIKTDMKHKNPAIRDWPAFRITEEEHPLVGKKYRVWPLMNFSVAVDDHESDMTHVIRGKDHLTNAERQAYIFKYFDWFIPEYIHTGRVNFEGIKISASQFTKDIEDKKYSGRDDSKLPTVAAFKKRGISADAFIQYTHEVGPSKVDKTVSYEEFMKAIYAYNRTIIEPKANRYFIVEDPIEIEVNNIPDNIKAEIPLHPNFPEKGVRKFKKSNKFFVEKKEDIQDKNYRLMHLCNFSGKDFNFISQNPEKDLKTKTVHWLPTNEENIKVLVKTPHGKDIKAIGEPSLKHIKENDIVQFERKFFAKFDSIDGDAYVFYETHK